MSKTKTKITTEKSGEKVYEEWTYPSDISDSDTDSDEYLTKVWRENKDGKIIEENVKISLKGKEEASKEEVEALQEKGGVELYSTSQSVEGEDTRDTRDSQGKAWRCKKWIPKNEMALVDECIPNDNEMVLVEECIKDAPKNGEFNGEYQSWHDNGQIKIKTNYSSLGNGKKHGKFEEWTEAGVKIEECNYKMGKVHGDYTQWDSNGVKIMKAVCEDGFFIKDKEFYFADGGWNCKEFYKNKNSVSLKCRYFEKDGKKEGKFEHWFNMEDGGGKSKEHFYKEGKLHGESKHWYKDGNLLHIVNRHEGEVISRKVLEGDRYHCYEFYPIKNKEGDSLYKREWYEDSGDGKKIGIYKKWYMPSPYGEKLQQLWKKCNYSSSGKKHGLFEIWERSRGHQILKCYYNNGKLDGRYIKWGGEDEIKIDCFYKDGKLHGPFLKRKFVSNWYQYIQCNYNFGELDGKYKKWDWEGMVVLKSFYEDGVQRNSKHKRDILTKEKLGQIKKHKSETLEDVLRGMKCIYDHSKTSDVYKHQAILMEMYVKTLQDMEKL